MENRKRGCGCGCAPILIIIILVAIFLVGKLGGALFENDSYDYTDDGDSGIVLNGDYEYVDSTAPDGYVPGAAPTEAPNGVLFSTLKLPLYRTKYFELDETGKTIYRGIREALINGKLEVTFPNADYETYNAVAFKAMIALYHDFPEFFWISCGIQHGDTYDGGYEIEIFCYDYWTYTTDRRGYVSAVENAVMRLYNEANAQYTDYDKMKYVHDYLVNNVYYDDVCAGELNQTNQRASSQQSHTIYGALVSNLAVCDGYSKTFQLITDMMGMDAEFVTGDGGGGHAWNYVTIDGQQYWMDVTWDDYDLEYEQGENCYYNYVSYDYYCVPDVCFYRDHTPDNYHKLPVCNAMTENYHVRNGYYLDYYDFDDVCDIFAKQQGSKYITVRFSSPEELGKAVNSLFGTFGKYGKIPYYGDIDNARYFSSEDTNTLTIIYH